MKDLMIDLETLGTDPDCVVISVGACFFDIEKKVIGPTFYMVLDVNEQITSGRKVSGDTIKWWMSQKDAAKKVFHEQAKPSVEVLKTFQTWMEANGSKTQVWGNGSHFDISIMESMYAHLGLKRPWLFYNVMDLRTFKRFVGKGAKVPKQGVEHNALADAISQAQYVLDHS